MIKHFEETMFTPSTQFKALTGGRPKEAAVVMSGLPPKVSAALSRMLAAHRVPKHCIMLR